MTDAELDKMMDEARQKAIDWCNSHGGSTGSNMAEPLWFPPGPIKIPDGLPPEERARRERLREELLKDPAFRKIIV